MKLADVMQPNFINAVLDFMHIYTGKTHYGREDILFIE